MPSIHSLERQKNLMTDAEMLELLEKGWHTDVVESLFHRGFRPCKPDPIDARFTGIDIDQTMGFLRQTSTPHLHISIVNDPDPTIVLERIDAAIYEAGWEKGHNYIAGLFNAALNRCKSIPAAADLSTLEQRLVALEAKSRAQSAESEEPTTQH